MQLIRSCSIGAQREHTAPHGNKAPQVLGPARAPPRGVGTGGESPGKQEPEVVSV